MTGAPNSPDASSSSADVRSAAMLSGATITAGVAVAPPAVEHAVRSVTAHRYALFDFDAYARDLQPLMRLAVASRDNGLFASWVHVNVSLLKHPERCTFLPDDPEWDSEFQEFDAGEYARFALTAFCEPETMRRLDTRVPALHAWLCEAGIAPAAGAQALLGRPIEEDDVRLCLPTGEYVGLLTPAETRKALEIGRYVQRFTRLPGSSQRLAAVSLSSANTNGSSHAPVPGATDDNGNGVGAAASASARLRGISQRRQSAKAVRRGLEQWCELLDEAVEVGVGMIYVYSLVDV